jgi:hypothetical protein
MFNRLALVVTDEDLAAVGVDSGNSGTQYVDAFRSYESGGLLNQVRPPIHAFYKSLPETLESTPVPQMLRGEEWESAEARGSRSTCRLRPFSNFTIKNNGGPAFMTPMTPNKWWTCV